MKWKNGLRMWKNLHRKKKKEEEEERGKKKEERRKKKEEEEEDKWELVIICTYILYIYTVYTYIHTYIHTYSQWVGRRRSEAAIAVAWLAMAGLNAVFLLPPQTNATCCSAHLANSSCDMALLPKHLHHHPRPHLLSLSSSITNRSIPVRGTTFKVVVFIPLNPSWVRMWSSFLFHSGGSEFAELDEHKWNVCYIWFPYWMY